MPRSANQVGKDIDKILTLDLDNRGIIDELYEATFDKIGRSPVMEAADSLINDISKDDEVLIMTGFPVGPSLVNETDGPVAAGLLARTIKNGLGAHPTILTEERGVKLVEAAAKAYGLSLDNFGNQEHNENWTCDVAPFPIDEENAKERADELIEEKDPAALITVEKGGANEKGEYHKAAGQNITDHLAKPEILCERMDGLAIGVGDGGNEFGMGFIEETIKEKVPYGDNCGCGCGGGVAASVEPDVLVPATISHWGGPGISAAISFLLEKPLLPSHEMEKRALERTGYAGAVDGVTYRADGTTDGVSPTLHAHIVDLLNKVIEESHMAQWHEEHA